MSQDEFTKLFKYMEGRFDTIEQKLDNKAEQSSLDSLQRTIDRLDEQEIGEALLQNRVDELVTWAKKVSKKTGIPLRNL